MSDRVPPVLRWVHLGRIGWDDAMRLQSDHWAAVRDDRADPVLLTLEHEPVVTLGRRGRTDDLLLPVEALAERGIQVREADRGGEVTYHGPGQLVVYAVLPVQRLGLGASDLVRRLAASIQDVLRSLGIDASWDDAHPGMWVRGRKICAVGMRVSRGVSTHGAAVNLDTALDAFDLFVPCGMPGARATSVASELGAAPSIEDMAARVAARFAERSGWHLLPSGTEALAGPATVEPPEASDLQAVVPEASDLQAVVPEASVLPNPKPSGDA